MNITKTISVAILLLVCFIGHSQSGWQTGRYYAKQGQAVTNCGPVYNQTCYNNFGQPYVCGRYQNCQTLVWEQEYYSGYVYMWGPNGWYTQWQEGTFWYCYWNNWIQYL